MTETRQTFRVSQKTETSSIKRQIEFMIDKGKVSPSGDIQHITLVVTEDSKKVLSISVDKETIVNLNEGTSYKFVIDIDRSTNKADTKLTAEVVTRGKDFWWFETPENSLIAYIREKSVESLVAEFVNDLLNFLSSNISVKARQE